MRKQGSKVPPTLPEPFRMFERILKRVLLYQDSLPLCPKNNHLGDQKLLKSPAHAQKEFTKTPSLQGT